MAELAVREALLVMLDETNARDSLASRMEVIAEQANGVDWYQSHFAAAAPQFKKGRQKDFFGVMEAPRQSVGVPDPIAMAIVKHTEGLALTREAARPQLAIIAIVVPRTCLVRQDREGYRSQEVERELGPWAVPWHMRHSR
jgi:hypothetical protein